MEDSVNILGVDFSGAAPDNNTWMAQGWLSGEGLELEACRRLSRGEVADILEGSFVEGSPAGTVASLDFPFSVPRQFAEYWMPHARSMPQLWAGAAQMDFPSFMALRDSFVAVHGEPKRLCDRAFPECYSCLHKANPNMVPMTFRGMQMLHRLWARGCDVPPLDSQVAGEPAPPVLLEAMPGAALRAMGLPYKGYKNGVRALELRRRILAELPQRSGLPMPNLDEFEEQCLFNHDCLDAVVAAVTAALWVGRPELFWRPQDPALSRPGSSLKTTGQLPNPVEPPSPIEGRTKIGESNLAAAILEGWLYAPVFIETNPVTGAGA